MKYQSSSAKKPPPPTKPKPNINQGDKNKEPVEVFCRLKPLKDQSDTKVVKKIDDEHLELSPPNNSRQVYKFKRIFDDKVEQQNIFNVVGFPLVKDLIKGQNGLIFSYGVTSSGKTYTITGTPQEPGIVPRTLDTIFNTLNKNRSQSIPYVFKPNSQNGFEIISTPDAILQQFQKDTLKTPVKSLINNNVTKTPISSRKRDLASLEWENRIQENAFVNEINCDNQYAVFVSYIEVYNNYVYDLLDDSFDMINANGNSAPRPKRIMEDAHKRYYVQGANEIEVKNSNTAFELCIKGMKRRRMGITTLNSESSRSHSVFNIRLVQAPLDLEGVEVINDKNYIHVSQLSIVDLAGCERTSRTQATGDRLREASNINNSLLTLRNCFDVLRENQQFNTRKMVPYRDNKLTHLFKSYFEGDGKVEMIICINPHINDCEETLQVCKFAETSQELTTNKGAMFVNPFHIPPKERYINLAVVAPGPPFPNDFLEDADNENVIPKWIDVLKKRIANYMDFIRFNEANQKIIREKIVQLEVDHNLEKQKNSVLQMNLEVRENQIKEYEQKFASIQRSFENNEDILRQQIRELEDKLNSASNSIDTLESNNAKIKTEFSNFKSSVKHDWKIERKRLQQHYIKKIEENEQELRKQLGQEQVKINIIKKILDNDDDLEFVRPMWMSPPPKQKDGANTPKTEIEIRGPPVANPRYMNPGEKWIDHRPPGSIELGTLFQPNINSKKRKSVTNLKASDFINNNGTNSASKYALTHHQMTNEGTVETQVIKGQVVPSSTGGAQVIFNDVETLTQTPATKMNHQNIKSAIQTRQRKRLAELWEMAATSSPNSSSSPSSSSNSKRSKRY